MLCHRHRWGAVLLALAAGGALAPAQSVRAPRAVFTAAPYALEESAGPALTAPEPQPEFLPAPRVEAKPSFEAPPARPPAFDSPRPALLEPAPYEPALYEPAPFAPAPHVSHRPARYTPKITYRYEHFGAHKGCRHGGPSITTVLLVTDCDGCVVEVPVKVPCCCDGSPRARHEHGLLGRSVTVFCWPCGFEARVVQRLRGDILVVLGAG